MKISKKYIPVYKIPMFSGTDSDSKIIITTRGDAILTNNCQFDSGETVELFRNKIGIWPTKRRT